MNTWIIIAEAVVVILTVRMVIIPRLLSRKKSRERHALVCKKLAYVITLMAFHAHWFSRQEQARTCYRYCLVVFRRLKTDELLQLHLYMREFPQSNAIIQHYEDKIAGGSTPEDLARSITD